MGELVRRRSNERFESWDIFYGDVKVGGISEALTVGIVPTWRWCCGFYPGSDKHQQSSGSEDTFEKAKAAFQTEWERLRPQITECMLDEWRSHRDFTAWKYAMHDAHCKMPTATTSGRSRCYCGAEITNATIEDHISVNHSLRQTHEHQIP